MANDLDAEIYPDNDDLVVCRPTRVQLNATTGVQETVALTGRTDVTAFLSLSGDLLTATAIHASLSKVLTEVGSTGAYSGVMEGSDKSTQLAATADGATLYRHFTAGQDYHEVKSVIFRKQRVAA